MIRHVFRLAWNRRRTNGLVMLELLLSFLILSGVLTLVCDGVINWMKPLGFDYENVWRMDIGGFAYRSLDAEEAAATWQTLEQLRLLARDMEEIESFSPLATNVPFSRASYGTYYRLDGAPTYVLDCEVLPQAMDVLRFRLLSGRWLEPGDEALNWEPLVITRDLAVRLFAGEDPVGRPWTLNDGEEGGRERRIVGVVAEYRHMGETQAAKFARFTRASWGSGDRPPRNFVFRLRPGTPAAFEETLLRAVHRVAPGWTVNVSRLTAHRDRLLRETMTVILIAVTVSGFVILMVGLGLVGVLWQSVTRRREEIGVRRAAGATAAHVHWQILGELLALTTIAAGIGTVLFLQLPLLQLFAWIPLHHYLLALGLALPVLYAFVAVCGLYPSRLATRIRPAAALQYE